MSVYEDFVQQIKAESKPPDGAFTMAMFAADTDLTKDKAKNRGWR